MQLTTVSLWLNQLLLGVVGLSGLAAGHWVPTARVRNGTYQGRYSPEYKQDYFLGIPYTQQPVGDLRYRVPRPLLEWWLGTRPATEYGPICVGYGTDSTWYPASEACLTLNIVRPSGVLAGACLPVGVYIHGGGFYHGSAEDQRYNFSFIIDNAVQIGKPFIGVSINYRLGAWGFLHSKTIVGSGSTNLGYRDQRLALQWIQENIAGFGGDPSKVTIWGESAGAISVGHHMIAYGGRDDHLFRAAIMQSGNMVTIGMDVSSTQNAYNILVNRTGCADRSDTLQCLRELPYDKLNEVLNATDRSHFNVFTPMVDGDLIRNYGSVHLSKGEVVKVPILIGTNADEGVSFGPKGINTTEEFLANLILGGMPPFAAQKILSLYPDDPTQGIPAFLGGQRVPQLGEQWRRTSAFAGDQLMHAGRRSVCQAWNFDGTGYHSGLPFNFTGPQATELIAKSRALSTSMASAWARFIVDMDPNAGVGGVHVSLGRHVNWPHYSAANQELLIFDVNTTTKVIKDDFRAEGMAYINSITQVWNR